VKFFAAIAPLGNIFLTQLADTANTVSGIENLIDKVGTTIPGNSSSGKNSLGHEIATAPTGVSLISKFGKSDIGNQISNFLFPSPTSTIHNGGPGGAPAPSLNAVALNNATSQLDPSALAILQQQNVAKQSAAAFGVTVDALNAATSASSSFATTSATSTLAMQLENNASGLLAASLQGLGGNTLGVAQANTAFH
jgi:hypothetical protein